MQFRAPAFVATIMVVLMAVQAAPQNGVRHRWLVVNGNRGQAEVVQLGTKQYIDVNALVQITQGTLSFQGEQIILTLPAPAAGDQRSGSQDPNALSREFMKAGLEEITLLREWASPVANAIENSFPITEQWVHGFRAKAADGLGMASVAATTPADKSAFELLGQEFKLVDAWSKKLLEAHESMNTAKYATSPGALKNESESQKIMACAHSLESMLVGGTFIDDGSCR